MILPQKKKKSLIQMNGNERKHGIFSFQEIKWSLIKNAVISDEVYGNLHFLLMFFYNTLKMM